MFTFKILRKLTLSIILLGGVEAFLCQNINAQSERHGIDERKKENAYHPEASEKNVKPERNVISEYAPEQEQISNKRNNKYREHKFSDTEINEKGNDEMSTLSFNIFLYVLDRFKEE